MAKQTEDREDLMRDATAYVQRIEFQWNDKQTIFVGFRQGGEPSFYFGQAFVLQFNAKGELRRAFWRDRLLASYQHQVHWLQKGDGRVRLQRTPLNDAEALEFLASAEQHLAELRGNLAEERLSVLAELADGQDLGAEISGWLQQHASPLKLALHPGIAN